jgi:hypothetical protein
MNPLRELNRSIENRRSPIASTETSTGLNADGAGETARIFDSECAELLHGLNNVFVGMLLNAQVLEWKLPSYSRLKRNLHEIERNAQRGGELVKRLLKRLDVPQPAALTGGQCSGEVPGVGVAEYASANQDPDAAHLEEAETTEYLAPTGLRSAGYRKKVPHTPV